MSEEREHLTLKWGTLKSWNFRNEATIEAAKKYAALGWSASAMTQPNTDAHRTALCELIDVIDADTIGNDWPREAIGLPPIPYVVGEDPYTLPW